MVFSLIFKYWKFKPKHLYNISYILIIVGGNLQIKNFKRWYNMDLMKMEIYCTYNNKNVVVNDCMNCDLLYECDNNWCDNHKCTNCENKKYGYCKSE